MSLFDQIHGTSYFKESVSDKKESILKKIEDACEEKGYTIKISKPSRECFISGKGSKGGGPGGPNSLCIAGMGKENYDNVYNLIKDIIKDEKEFSVTQDNYFTLFLDYNNGSKDENELSEESVNVYEAGKIKTGLKMARYAAIAYAGISTAIKLRHQEEFKKMEKLTEYYSLMSYFIPFSDLNKKLRNPITDIVVEYQYEGDTIFKYNTRYNKIIWIDSIYSKFKDFYEIEIQLNTLGDKLSNDIWMQINDLYYKIYGDEPYEESVDNEIPKITNLVCFKGTDGCDNTIVNIDGYDKPLRAKSEVIIFDGKDNTSIFLRRVDKKGYYKLPGGTWDKNEDPKDAAIRETKEEARINIKNVNYVTTRIEPNTDQKKYMKDIPDDLKWDGYYCQIYTAEYDSPFTGHIDKVDEDRDLTYNGKFYPISEVYDKLRPEHKEAITNFLNSKGLSLNESVDEDEIDSFIFESAGDTYVIKSKIYPIVEKTLSDPQKDKKFRNAVRSYIDRNSTDLHTSGTVNLVPFTDSDKEIFYNIFDTNKDQLIGPIDEMTKSINDKANWRLLRQNPIFCLFYECIRYYTIKKDKTGVNIALAIYALSVYPSVFAMLFQYGTNADVMKFTMDNLSAKYLMKQEGSVFGGLMKSIQNSYNFLKPNFIDSSDKEVVRFITRIRNDQKSLFKNIATQYYQNHQKGLRASTQSETYGDNQLIDDNMNNTTIVEDVTRKIVLSLITNGVDLTRATAASKITNISLVELRFYLNKIITEDRSDELRQFIEAVLFAFLYQDKHQPYEINEKKFLQFCLEYFRKTNTNDKNISTFKYLLDKWSADVGINAKYKRLASQIAYKRAIYTYIILCIQYYNQ